MARHTARASRCCGSASTSTAATGRPSAQSMFCPSDSGRNSTVNNFTLVETDTSSPPFRQLSPQLQPGGASEIADAVLALEVLLEERRELFPHRLPMDDDALSAHTTTLPEHTYPRHTNGLRRWPERPGGAQKVLLHYGKPVRQLTANYAGNVGDVGSAANYAVQRAALFTHGTQEDRQKALKEIRVNAVRHFMEQQRARERESRSGHRRAGPRPSPRPRAARW